MNKPLPPDHEPGQIPARPVAPAPRRFSILGLAVIGFKLLKSAKLFKLALASTSVAAYSWLFSIEFALALLACLVFHEYGHIRAMKYFGMKTKGIYLIPFVGGLAVTDERIKSRWQDVVISIMGPMFGLFLSGTALVLFLITGNPLFAGLAAFNSLLNMFNLLPILPLDGGHILKSIAFSVDSMVGVALCIAGAALGVYLSYTFGLALLAFVLVIGSLEIVFEWRMRKLSRLIPMDRYGQWFSAAWYGLVVLGFVSIMFYLAAGGDSVLSLPLEFLRS